MSARVTFVSPWVMALAVLSLLAVCACENDQRPKPVDMSRRVETPVKNRTNELTYAYLPQYTPAVSFKLHRLIVDRLAKNLGRPVRQVFPGGFDEHITMFGQGLIDISFSNPFVYIQIAENNGAKAIGRIVNTNGQGLSGLVICRRDRKDLNTLADCRGKRWIATDPASAGGYLYPLGLFYEKGLRKSDFAEIVFAGGNQEKVVYSVFRGEYDVGTIRNGTLEIMQGQVPLSEIRVLARTRDYPNWVYAVRGGLDPALADAIKTVLTSLDPAVPEDKEILDQAGIERVLAATDADFDPLRTLILRIGKDEKTLR